MTPPRGVRIWATMEICLRITLCSTPMREVPMAWAPITYSTNPTNSGDTILNCMTLDAGTDSLFQAHAGIKSSTASQWSLLKIKESERRDQDAGPQSNILIISWNHLVEMKGFEPSTPALRTRCSPAELHPHNPLHYRVPAPVSRPSCCERRTAANTLLMP